MAYRKSYYEQRMEEQSAIQEAIEKQRLEKLAEEQAEVEEVVEEVLVEDIKVVSEETKPDESNTKAEIQAYLDEHEIKYSRWMTKAKLLELID